MNMMCPFHQVLAKKMTVLYQVAQQQLSKQSHYDWGLRALTAVLRMAGKLRRDSPGLSEIMVLMRALRYTGNYCNSMLKYINN